MDYPWTEESCAARSAGRRVAAFSAIIALATVVMGVGLSLAYAGLPPDRKAIAQPVVHRALPGHGVARIAALHHDFEDDPEPLLEQSARFVAE